MLNETIKKAAVTDFTILVNAKHQYEAIERARQALRNIYTDRDDKAICIGEAAREMAGGSLWRVKYSIIELGVE